LCDVFTRHVRDYGTSDDHFEEFWARFVMTLRSELHTRRLIGHSPKFLGYDVIGSWNDAAVFDELATDCYIAAVLARMEALKPLLLERSSVGGAVRNNMRLFLINCQRDANPTGYKIYKNIEAIMNEAVATGEMRIAGVNRGKFGNDALLCLADGPPAPPIVRTELEKRIDNSQAWSKAIRSITGSENAARQPFLEALRSLRDEGIGAVRVGELVNALKERVEELEHPGFGNDLAWDVWGFIRTIQPDSRYEDEESRARRNDRIREKIRCLRHGPRVHERIRKIFERLLVLDLSTGKPNWEEVYKAEGISKTTFWEYISELRSIIKEIDGESCD
jgi:hypothetical protein